MLEPQVQKAERPNIFNYANFRLFMADYYEFLRQKNNSFSESALIQKAGYGRNSRGYFRLIVKGKRNLSAKSIVGFSDAFKLTQKEAHYFEGLVFYNQSKSEKDKRFYFDRISKAIKGQETPIYQLMKSQFNYFSKWHLVAIRELVGLDQFIEDEDWICRILRGKVTKKEVKEAIDDLLSLGLLERVNGQLKQSNKMVQFVDDELNHSIANGIHKQFLGMTSQLLDQDGYENRSASSVTLSCHHKDFLKIRKEVSEFRKYSLREVDVDTVLHMGVQLIHLTEPSGDIK